MSTGILKGRISAGVQLGGQIRSKETLGGRMNVPETFGTNDHTRLTGRDVPDQHPMEAITGLRVELNGKLSGAGFLSNMDIQKILDS